MKEKTHHKEPYKEPMPVGGIAADQLRSFIDRMERLEEEKAGIMEQIRDVGSEAKSSGFDLRTLSQIIRMRKQDADDLEEQRYLLDLYKQALGMGTNTGTDKE